VARENPRVALAEIVVLLVIVGVCYAALGPLRRRIERALLRRWRKGGATVIPLVRGGDGVYVPHRRRGADHGDER
jgi:hypothetical protein